MGEPGMAGIVEMIRSDTILEGAAVTMEISVDVLPSLVSHEIISRCRRNTYFQPATVWMDTIMKQMGHSKCSCS